MEDGIKCANGKMCYDQRCVSVSSLGFPQCPNGSNGLVCSGNGVKVATALKLLNPLNAVHIILKFCRCATMKEIVRAPLISLEKLARAPYVCVM